MLHIKKLSENELNNLIEISKNLTESDIQRLVEQLNTKDNMEGLSVLSKLYYRSYFFNDVYPYFNLFVDLLRCDNSFRRTRGIYLISVNAKWDTQNKFEEIADEFLSHTEDEKPITSRACIKSLENILPYKVNLHEKIKEKINSINYLEITESMRDLIFKDGEKILKMIHDYKE